MIEILCILVLLPFLVVTVLWALLWASCGGRAMLAVVAFCFLGFVVEPLWRAVFPKRSRAGARVPPTQAVAEYDHINQ